MLERVEVLELDHEHRPVGDMAVGEQPPLGPAAKALDGQPGVVGQLLERLRGVLPEVAQRVRRDLGLEPGAELGTGLQGALEVRGVHPRDDHAPEAGRRKETGQVQADDGPAGVGELLPERRHADPARVVDLHPARGRVVIAMVEDAVPRRVAAGHHRRPGGRRDRRNRSRAGSRARRPWSRASRFGIRPRRRIGSSTVQVAPSSPRTTRRSIGFRMNPPLSSLIARPGGRVLPALPVAAQPAWASRSSMSIVKSAV